MSFALCCRVTCHNTVEHKGLHILHEVDPDARVCRQEYRGESYCSARCLHLDINEGAIE